MQAASWDESARVSAEIPSRVLMESAGRALAAVMAGEFAGRLESGVLLVAGHGNNGGDGWVAARALRAMGVPVWAVDEARERSDDCEANRRLALDDGVELLGPEESWPPVGVVVDALLGTGASGKPRGAIGSWAERISRCGAPIVAVDGPTGLDLSTGEAHGPIRADLTVTFGGARRGHLLARPWCGKVVVVDIGFPAPDPEWPVLVDDGWARAALPPFEAAMHKGDRGRVLVIGGDHGMAGAAVYAAKAALAAGAGLAKIAAHEVTVAAAQELVPDALTVTTSLGSPLEPELAQAIEWADSVILGPGLGRGEERSSLVFAVLQRLDKPVVIDADALHVGFDILSCGAAPRVLTPHPGEFAVAFCDLAAQLEDDRLGAAAGAAATLASALSAATPPSAVLLKGVPTAIAVANASLRVVASGNPALATGGSGDVLAGFIGAFLARGVGTGDAAALGAHIMGRAAELASADHKVRSTRPADVIAGLPALWRLLAQQTVPCPPILVELPPPALV